MRSICAIKLCKSEFTAIHGYTVYRLAVYIKQISLGISFKRSMAQDEALVLISGAACFQYGKQYTNKQQYNIFLHSKNVF